MGNIFNKGEIGKIVKIKINNEDKLVHLISDCDLGSELVYFISDCGLGSELINLIKGAIYADRQNLQFIINDTNWNNGNWNDFFVSDIEINRKIKGKTICLKPSIDRQKNIKILNRPAIDVWYDIYNLKTSYNEMRSYAKKIFILNPKIMNHIIQTKSIPIKKNYIGVHIRRGDKITTKESREIPIKFYIDEIVKYSDIKHIYFASDDTNFVKEIINELNEKYPNYYTFEYSDKYINGHNQFSYNKLSLIEKKEKVIDLIYDIQRLILSKVFICTFSSNISRFVELFRDDKSISLDCPWHTF